MKNEETRPGAPPVDGPAEAAQAQDGVPAAVSSTGPDVAKRYHMPGELIRDRFRVEEQIGQGAFGVIFGGVDTTTRNEVAIKCEWIEARRTVLRAEVLALKHLQSCPYVVRYITSGCHQNSVNYVIMERMGMNLVEARRHSKPPGDLDDAMVSTQLILHMLHAIHGIHNLGYVHRDIKPSNFVLRRSVTDLISSVNTEACYLIDFGLARRFRNEDGSLIPAREHTGFRGTTRYASMNSHLGRELGPVDDLWSLFYVYVEFIRGELPWRKRKEKDEILSLKQAHDESLAEGLPAEIGSFQQHLRTLSYPDTPNYELLEELLQTIHSNYKVAYQQQTEKQNIVNPLTPQTDYLKDPAAMGLSQTGQTNDTGHKSSGASHRKTPHSTGNDSQQAEDASKPKIHKSGSSSRLSIAGNSNIPTMSQSNRNSVVLQTNTTGKCVLETGKLTQKVHSTTARISPKNMHVRKSNPSNAKLGAMRVARPAAIAYHQDKNHSIVPENGGVNSPLLRETSFSGTFVGNELIAMTRTDTRVFECYGTVPNAVTMLPSEFFNPPIMSSISVADSLIAQRVREEQAVLPNDEASPRFLNNGTSVNNSARKAFSVQQCNMSEENGSEMNIQSAGSRSASKKREGNAVPEMNENNVLDNNKHRIATQQVIPSYHNNNKKRDHCSCCTIM